MFSTKRYMSSRQLQKLSSPGPRRSVSPARPRWKAWLCRLGSPGSAIAWRSSVGAGAAFSVTRSMYAPVALRRTPRAQPCGSSADSNHRLAMGYIPVLVTPPLLFQSLPESRSSARRNSPVRWLVPAHGRLRLGATEDVPGRIHVPIVRLTTVDTRPPSYTQPVDALRSSQRSAGRTGAAGVPLADN